MQDFGVAATAKHFPGLGAARENTDFAVQRIGLSRRALRRIDERVYRPFEAIGGELVMLDTAIYPAFDRRPAAFSRRIATRELRHVVGFGGVSITDSLGSAAARAFARPDRAGVAAAGAGADLLLYTDYRDAARARRALLRALRTHRLRRRGFLAAVQRVLSLRHRLVDPPTTP
jgi:beta-N-acetylhexosaminidase